MKKVRILAIFLILAMFICVLSGCKSSNNSKNGEATAKADVQPPREYQEPIEKYFKGLNKCDAEIYASAYPEFEDMASSVKDMRLSERKKSLERVYGDNIKYEFKILKEKEIDSRDLKKIEEYVKKRYKKNVKITKGYNVKTEQKIKGDEDFDYATDEITVLNIDGTWYITNMDLDTIE